MEKIVIQSVVHLCSLEELTPGEQQLVGLAIEATSRSYSPYSHFSVGAAVRLEGGETVIGCNQENAAFPVTLCAERTAIFAAGAQHPDKAVTALAIAARSADGQLTEEPISPCGSCRQVMVETETRFHRPITLLLYGRKGVYRIEGTKHLMPLTFSEF